MKTTKETIYLTSPDGDEIEVPIQIAWEFMRNPCDREPRMYRGEEDGWCVVEILVDELQ